MKIQITDKKSTNYTYPALYKNVHDGIVVLFTKRDKGVLLYDPKNELQIGNADKFWDAEYKGCWENF